MIYIWGTPPDPRPFARLRAGEGAWPLWTPLFQQPASVVSQMIANQVSSLGVGLPLAGAQLRGGFQTRPYVLDWDRGSMV